jgi:hypothetical protein
MNLLPESVFRLDGSSPEFALAAARGKPLLLTLGITRAVEHESLDLSVWGSEDQSHWHKLTAFPRKFYCGTYFHMLDLTRRPEIRYLRAQWQMSRWGAEDATPLFGFGLLVEETKLKTAGAG